MLRHIRLLVFDLDYILFDSAGLKVKALRQSLISFADAIPQSAHLPDESDAEDGFREHGSRWIESLEVGLSEDLMPLLNDAYRIHEQKLIGAGMGQIYAGISQILENCRRQDVSMALGAEASRDYLMAVSDRHQLDDLFGNALCTEEFGMGSVAEMLEETMRLTEVNRSETVVLGTRPEFFRAARDLDLVTVGCGWGIQHREFLAEANYRSLTPAEILPAILQADELAMRYY